MARIKCLTGAFNGITLRTMETSPSGPSAPSAPPAPSSSRPTPSGKVGWSAFTVALIALVASWVSYAVGPAAGRQAIARGDVGNVFTVLIAAWAITIALDLVAIALGVIGARRPVGKVLSGAAIGIGATGVLGLLAYLIQTGLIGFLF